MTKHRRSHLPQTFYTQLSIYVAVNIVLVLAAVAARGARWWYWMIPVVWGIALAIYGVWLYWFTGEQHGELPAGQQQAIMREKDKTVDWAESAGDSPTSGPLHP